MSLSRVQLFVTPRTVACPASLSMGILQARILEWVAMPSSRGSSQPRDRTQVSCIAGRILYHLSHQGSSEGRAKWKVIDRTIWGAFTGQQPSKVKTMKPPAKVKIPQAEVQDEEPEEEEQRAGGEEAGGRLGLRGSAQGLTSFLSSWAGPSAPPPQVVKKPPLSQGAARAAQEAEAEPATEVGPGGGHRPAGGKAVVRSSDPEPWRAEPSREIRNIIRMYQSRPGPVPVPVQPARCQGKGGGEGKGRGKGGGEEGLTAPQRVTL